MSIADTRKVLKLPKILRILISNATNNYNIYIECVEKGKVGVIIRHCPWNLLDLYSCCKALTVITLQTWHWSRTNHTTSIGAAFTFTITFCVIRAFLNANTNWSLGNLWTHSYNRIEVWMLHHVCKQNINVLNLFKKKCLLDRNFERVSSGPLPSYIYQAQGVLDTIWLDLGALNQGYL